MNLNILLDSITDPSQAPLSSVRVTVVEQSEEKDKDDFKIETEYSVANLTLAFLHFLSGRGYGLNVYDEAGLVVIALVREGGRLQFKLGGEIVESDWGLDHYSVLWPEKAQPIVEAELRKVIDGKQLVAVEFEPE